jgi:uncharacterized protein YecE (DUF72 family)
MAAIRVGIGGWVFPPWRGEFYPKGLVQAKELDYASRHVTSIEINATFYGAQRPTSFQKWYGETPDDFVFSLKGPRVVTHRRALGEAGPSIERFVGSGIVELKDKLGPILWQFPATTKFDPANFAAFLDLLPPKVGGRGLRHVVEVGHDSFQTPEFIEMLRTKKIAVAFIDSDRHPPIWDVTADFIYARLRRTEEDVPTGYKPKALDLWANRFVQWSKGGAPADVKRTLDDDAPKQPRDCFVYFISGAKVRAPAAAQAMIERIRA